jgi:hypothetical protein
MHQYPDFSWVAADWELCDHLSLWFADPYADSPTSTLLVVSVGRGNAVVNFWTACDLRCLGNAKP